MSLYRGAGGASDATDDSTVNAVAGYASAAASSASSAATSATSASNSASAAASSASGAASSASSVATNASNAASSASLASTYAANASASKDAAAASAATASTKAGEATSSASSAAADASTATTKAAEAAASALSADGSADDAAASAADALAIYGSTAAVNAAVASAAASAVTASTQAGYSSDSASESAASAVLSYEYSQNSAEWASFAQGSANSAAASASSALAIYGNTSAMNQAVQTSTANAAQAVTSANAAAASASSAATSATTATTQATAAATSAAQASAVALGNEPVRHSVRPSLLLDFANTKALDPRITFTRASTGTFYDGKTVAKAEENLLLRSQEFDNASWAKSRTTVTANAIAAPDGTTSADAVYETVDTNTHYVNQAITPNGQAYTISVFAKGGLGRDWVWIRTVVGGPAERTAFFDVTNGVVGNVGSGLTASITSVGGGWYRCVVSTTNSSTTIDAWGFGPASANGTSNYAGDITKGIYLWGAQLEQRSSVTAYTPTTTAPITNYIPVLQTAASGVARFDHNPVTGESLGLLIEEQRTNLLTYSEQFDNAAWAKTRCNVTANIITAPDGLLTGDKLVENTDANTHFLTATIALSDNVVHTASVYMKAAERLWGYITVVNKAASNRGAYFNLSTGTVGTVTAGETATITDVGNGWYRCTLTLNVGTGATTPQMRVWTANGNGSSNYTGDGYSGIYIWGAQLEVGSFATSYIPTVASQVTRSADSASMTGTNFSSWYRADEGTLYAESAAFVAAGFSRAMQISDGTTTNFISATTNTSQIRNGGVFQTSLNTPGSGVVAGVFYKVALGYKVDDIAASTNGAATLTDSSATLPSASRLQIGGETSSVGSNGNIKKLAYYPKRLTNAELQGLTTV